MLRDALYDGLAAWYDEWIHHGDPGSSEAARLLRELVGPGPGRCLDLGCGGGAFIPTLLEAGWDVVGADLSQDQLAFARKRVGPDVELVQADATHLPFPARSFDAVVAAFVSTDIEPFEAVVAEAVRVLRPRGRFVHLGTHPCFIGPFSTMQEDGTRVIGAGYRERSRQLESAAFRQGLRARVGAVHVPLADLLNAVLDAGLVLEQVVESSEEETPVVFGLRCRSTPFPRSCRPVSSDGREGRARAS